MGIAAGSGVTAAVASGVISGVATAVVLGATVAAYAVGDGDGVATVSTISGDGGTPGAAGRGTVVGRGVEVGKARMRKPCSERVRRW